MNETWKEVSSCNTKGIINPDEIEYGIRDLAYQAGFDPDLTVDHVINGNIFTVMVSPELFSAMEVM